MQLLPAPPTLLLLLLTATTTMVAASGSRRFAANTGVVQLWSEAAGRGSSLTVTHTNRSVPFNSTDAAGTTVVAAGGRPLLLFALGKTDEDTAQAVAAYSPRNRTWLLWHDALSVPRAQMAATSAGATALFAGGEDAGKIKSAVVDVYGIATHSTPLSSSVSFLPFKHPPHYHHQHRSLPFTHPPHSHRQYRSLPFTHSPHFLSKSGRVAQSPSRRMTAVAQLQRERCSRVNMDMSHVTVLLHTARMLPLFRPHAAPLLLHTDGARTYSACHGMSV